MADNGVYCPICEDAHPVQDELWKWSKAVPTQVSTFRPSVWGRVLGGGGGGDRGQKSHVQIAIAGGSIPTTVQWWPVGDGRILLSLLLLLHQVHLGLVHWGTWHTHTQTLSLVHWGTWHTHTHTHLALFTRGPGTYTHALSLVHWGTWHTHTHTHTHT